MTEPRTPDPRGRSPYGPPPSYGAPGRQAPPPYGAPDHHAPPPYGAAPPPHGAAQRPSGAAQQSYGAPPPPPPPGGGAPGYGAPLPPPPPLTPKKKGRGGRIALIVGAVVLVVLVGGGYLAYRAVTDFVSDVTGGGSLAGAGAGCSFVSADDVNGTLGGTYELVELGGLGGVAGVALDSRVLPDAPTCWGVDNGDGKLVRIARYEGADAAEVFAREKQTAGGTSEDRGNGITVSTQGYLAGDAGTGDESFCTTGDGTTAAGALVRVGDRLVYVSTTAAGGGAGSPPQIDVSGDNPGFSTDADNCRLSAELASKVG